MPELKVAKIFIGRDKNREENIRGTARVEQFGDKIGFDMCSITKHYHDKNVQNRSDRALEYYRVFLKTRSPSCIKYQEKMPVFNCFYFSCSLPYLLHFTKCFMFFMLSGIHRTRCNQQLQNRQEETSFKESEKV